MLRVINKEYLISSLKEFNEKVLSKIYAKISENQSVLDKIDESDGTLTFNGNKIGLKGDPGQDGIDGVDGKSAYEIAVDCGYTGSETEWIESLHGTKGDKGDAGLNGNDGVKGDSGESAYEIAVKNGFSGNEKTWLESLKGDKGDKGNSGSNGENGVSITNIEQTTTSALDGGTNIVTVTLSNGQTFDFNIKNGSKGSTGDKGDPGQNVSIDDITPEIIDAANKNHTHGAMATITFSSTEPTSVADGEIVMVYEE